MTVYNTFIVDDEPDAGYLLQNLLISHPTLCVSKIITNAQEAIDALIDEQPPVVFCDIGMPQFSGIELLELVTRYSPKTKVIFVTAYKDYALEAIQKGAFDFMCKPIDKSDLRRVVHKLIAALQSQQLNYIEETYRVLLKTTEGHHYIAVDEVLFLEADSNYTYLTLKDGRKLLSSVNLGKVHTQFPGANFVRISRKHVINKNYLSFMNFCKRYCIVSHNGDEYQLEVSVKMRDLKQELS
ncbi:LytTR family DNA-binding domain-containing protein [uncultured Draconibacterium sp.]|uniref:LytR/AlgR family response regulator transcription factor n=1 Tax=uncultured Draconibacterium sp. TaxID=1573823 RepID=UPI002AA619C4|nr:LytTR family DNA-binding domain-containing protein [uncultured Draconibacterium sp.]